MRRRSSFYVAASTGTTGILTAAQSLILIPLFVRQLGARVYGAWLGSGDVLHWMLLADLGIPNLLIQKVGAAHARGDERDAAEWLSAGLAVMVVIATLLAIGGVFVSAYIPRLYDLAADDALRLSRTLAIASVATAVMVLNNVFYGYARAVQRAGRLSAFSLAATVGGFAGSLVLVLRGFGLYAIAAGFLIRAIVLVIGMALFFITEIPRSTRQRMALRSRLMNEMARAAPATTLAGFAYAAMYQSELLIVSLLLAPELAAVLMLNRKALELTRSLADTVVWGSYGSFAHLVASAERSRALMVYREIISIRSLIAVALGGGYIALNASFIHVWVGQGNYGGIELTLLYGIVGVIAGNAFLVNYLYRAAGFVVEGSLLLLAESVLRVVLMAGLCLTLGLPGIPLAAIVTAVPFLYITHRRLRGYCLEFGAEDKNIPPRFWVAGAVSIAAAAAVGKYVLWPHWAYVLAGGALLAACIAIALIKTNPYLRSVRSVLPGLRRRVVHPPSLGAELP